MANKVHLSALLNREIQRLTTRPLYICCIFVLPILCSLFFTSLMDNGLPYDLPVGIVDQDNTSTTRSIIRNLNAFEQTGLKQAYADVAQARQAMQRGEIYAFFYIPTGTTENVISGRQPHISFYTNNSYLIAGSLIYRDMRTMAVLANASVGLKTMQARGINEKTAREQLQPIVIDTHAIHNPWLNYSVYLNNTILPGILMIMIMMLTVFSLGSELKENTAHEWMRLAGNRIGPAIATKLLPYTCIFTMLIWFLYAYLYGILRFPCYSSMGGLALSGLMLVLSSQALGMFFFILFPTMRLALSTCSLWGVVAFSISGFTFPIMAMPPSLQALSNLFPLRHYFLIYVSQILNGYPIYYAWQPYMALLIFTILPFLLLWRLKYIFLHYKYIP